MTGQLDTGFLLKKFWPKAATASAEGSPWHDDALGIGPLLGSSSGGGTATLGLVFSGRSRGETVQVGGVSVDGTAIITVADIPTSPGDDAADVALAVAAGLDGLQDGGGAITLAADAEAFTVLLTASGGASNVFDADATVSIA